MVVPDRNIVYIGVTSQVMVLQNYFYIPVLHYKHMLIIISPLSRDIPLVLQQEMDGAAL